MQIISKAPDATVLLSTAALIVGVFLAAAAAALIGYLPKTLAELMRPAKVSTSEDKYLRLLRAILFALLMINAIGTAFLFTLLFANTMTSIRPVWVWIGFFYTLFVITANLGVVSMTYLGPISARRRRRATTSAPRSAQETTLRTAAPSSESIDRPISDRALQNARRRTSVSLAFGFAAGIVTGILFRQSGKQSKRSRL